MAIPDFDETTGYLPPGRHSCSWAELVERFSWNPHCLLLADQLLDGLFMLKLGGCRRVWVNGSYVTDKEEPGDVDVLWDAHGVQPRNLDPVFRHETKEHHQDRKKRLGGDYFPVYDDALDGAMIQHFQTDRADIAKGILQLELNTLPKREQHDP